MFKKTIISTHTLYSLGSYQRQGHILRCIALILYHFWPKWKAPCAPLTDNLLFTSRAAEWSSDAFVSFVLSQLAFLFSQVAFFGLFNSATIKWMFIIFLNIGLSPCRCKAVLENYVLLRIFRRFILKFKISLKILFFLLLLNFLPAANTAAGSFKKRSHDLLTWFFPWCHSFSNEEFLREKIERKRTKVISVIL